MIAVMGCTGRERPWEANTHICVDMFVMKHNRSVAGEGILASIMMGMQAILILFIAGMLAGCRIRSGVVPSMIRCGLNILSPSIFPIAALLTCGIGVTWRGGGGEPVIARDRPAE